jgi:hypothetical protein
MPGAESGVLVRPTDIERWLDDLGLVPSAREDRDGVTSWDLRLDGRRRFDVPITLILDPAFALICWVHFAPPIGDAFRKSYRKLLRWNDEYPFVKFSWPGRPAGPRDRDRGRGPRSGHPRAGVARSLAIADRLLEVGGLAVDRRADPGHERTDEPRRGLLDRFADRLGELAGTPAAEPRPRGPGRRPWKGRRRRAPEIEAAIPWRLRSGRRASAAALFALLLLAVTSGLPAGRPAPVDALAAGGLTTTADALRRRSATHRSTSR